MGKKTVSILLVLAWLSCTLNGDSAFAHTAAIESGGDNRYAAVRLTPQIYNAANGDLSDLRILDSKGETVPYFIHSSQRRTYTNSETYPMTLIQSYLMEDSFYFDYRLAAARSGDAIATSLAFTTGNTNFAKELDLYGSYDNIHWDFVQNDTIYSIDGIAKLFIDFQQTQKFTHYRLRLANNLEQITFDGVSLVYNFETSEDSYFIESMTPAYTVESGDRQTRVHMEGLQNLRLCDISLHSDSMFKRNAVTLYGISKEIYSLSLNGTSYADTTIAMNGNSSPEESLSLTIIDADDKPIDIRGITVRYYADELVFERKEGEAYTLDFGRDATKRTPVYDIERYKNEVLLGAIDRAEIGEIRYVIEVIAPERDYRMLFNIVIVVVALLLGIVILRKLRKA